MNFLAFRDLNEVKWGYDFGMSIFHQEKRLKHLDLTRWARRAKRGLVACPGRENTPTTPLFLLECPIRLILLPTDFV
jgi:hypothetical protein